MTSRNKSVVDAFSLIPAFHLGFGRRGRCRLIVFLLPVLMGLAGCGANIPVYKVSLETIETPRPEEGLVGNRGYIVGTPPATHGTLESPPPVKKVTRLRIQKKKTVRFEPWKAIMALDRWIREHMW